mmetsp:Transcript_84532/g.220762  ORF Transcript_84532/g.220762 Transcript_84532/m.220762 type:complete len:234 (+) Transcript_84532:600-1301(+)
MWKSSSTSTRNLPARRPARGPLAAQCRSTNSAMDWRRTSGAPLSSHASVWAPKEKGSSRWRPSASSSCRTRRGSLRQLELSTTNDLLPAVLMICARRQTSSSDRLVPSRATCAASGSALPSGWRSHTAITLSTLFRKSLLSCILVSQLSRAILMFESLSSMALCPGSAIPTLRTPSTSTKISVSESSVSTRAASSQHRALGDNASTHGGLHMDAARVRRHLRGAPEATGRGAP